MKTWKLVSGIVSIATRNGSKGGNIALIVLFLFGAICAILAAVSLKKGQ